MTNLIERMKASLVGATDGPWEAHKAKRSGDFAITVTNNDILAEVFEDIRQVDERIAASTSPAPRRGC